MSVNLLENLADKSHNWEKRVHRYIGNRYIEVTVKGLMGDGTETVELPRKAAKKCK